jgi:putative transcriptional regulator
MKTVKIKISPSDTKSGSKGGIDTARVDATTESEIQAHIAEDEKEAMLDAAKFARRVRKLLNSKSCSRSLALCIALTTHNQGNSIF